MGLILIYLLSKLLQEPQISVIEELDIIDSVTKHGDSFHSHAESKAADLLGFVVNKSIDRWIDHAATKQFDPSTLFAQPAWTTIQHAGAAALEATDLYIGARFGEREERGIEAGLHA